MNSNTEIDRRSVEQGQCPEEGYLTRTISYMDIPASVSGNEKDESTVLCKFNKSGELLGYKANRSVLGSNRIFIANPVYKFVTLIY